MSNSTQDQKEKFEPSPKQPGFLAQLLDAGRKQENISRDGKMLFFSKNDNEKWELPEEK